MATAPRKVSPLHGKPPQTPGPVGQQPGRIRTPVHILLLCLAGLAGLPGSAWGGLYNPCEQKDGPFPIDWNDANGRSGFFRMLMTYRSIRMGEEIPQDNATRLRYTLIQQIVPGDVAKLAPLRQLALSEYLIRTGEAVRAQFLLKSLSRRDSGNFLIHCNLAAAYEQTQEYDKAISAMSDALGAWPSTWDKLTPAQMDLFNRMRWSREVDFGFYHEAEKYFLRLLRSREAHKKKPQDAEIDPIFFNGKDPAQAVRYVDEAGNFTPGKLAAAELAKLPDGLLDKMSNAIGIVQQLLIWMPWDRNLYRQLGELYSARGKRDDIEAARRIFKDLVDPGNSFGQNWQISRNPDVRHRADVLQELTLPEPPPPGGLGEIIKNSDKPQTESAPMSWQNIWFIFGFGIIVGVVGQWQINEIRRRRQRAAALRTSEAPVSRTPPPPR